METGYQCQRCGYEPNESELSGGSCPLCSGPRLHVWRTLPGELEALPIGSSIQVFNRRYDPTGAGRHYEVTLFLWTLTERDASGKAVWRGHVGRSTFVDALGLEQVVHVERYAETRFHDPLRMTSDAVAHFTAGEMTYGAWYGIHDVTPTTRFLTVQRMMDDMGWVQPARQWA